MNKEEVTKLIQRFGARFYKKENYYAMDYGTRFNPTRDPKTNKIKYKRTPGDKLKPFWFCNYPTTAKQKARQNGERLMKMFIISLNT